MDTHQIPENFMNWACSLSGCDGGNINAETWVCGIEWGNADGDYYKKLPEEINKGKATPPCDKFDWEESITYPYGRSFAKLYAAIRGKEVQDYKDLIDGYDDQKWDGSELFKLNLYPISFSSTDESLWRKNNLDKITGFDEKYLFQTWCFFNRFPEFSAMRAEKKPKLIIGTGNGYLRDFLMCFAWGKENSNAIKGGRLKSNSKANGKERVYYWVEIEETTLFVIPFLSGPYGLNSDYLLQKMGEIIQKKVTVK